MAVFRSLLALLGCALLWQPQQASGEAGALAAAVANLRAAEEAESRATDDYQTLRTSGTLSAAELDEYRAYLGQLHGITQRYRQEVATLHGAAPPAPDDAAQAAALRSSIRTEQTAEERTAALDAALRASLGDFDEMLLREQEELAQKTRAASATEAAEGASGIAGSADESGARAGRAGAAAAGEQAGGETGQAGSVESARLGQPRTTAGGGYGGTKERTGKSSAPEGMPDGHDDDVVARQLREAAEKESDPALKKKLWIEYRNYKNAPR